MHWGNVSHLNPEFTDTACLVRRLPSRSPPVSTSHAVRLYMSHHVHAEFRHLNPSLDASKCPPIHLSQPQTYLICVAFIYLVYVYAQAWVCTTVKVWPLNDNLSKLVFSFYHVVLGIKFRLSSLVAVTFIHQTILLALKLLLYLRRTCLLSRSLVFAYFLKWFLKLRKEISFYKQNHSGQKKYQN